MSKAEIRRFALEWRSKKNEKERAEDSKKIFNRVTDLPEFDAAGTVLIYVSYRSEVDTGLLISYALSLGKEVCVPIVVSDCDMVASRLRACEDFGKNIYGIPEPTSTDEVPRSKIDLVILPGCAFDEQKNRIGYGKGYFDRFLEGCKATKIALAFEEQIVPQIPCDPTDVRMDVIVTPERVIR